MSLAVPVSLYLVFQAATGTMAYELQLPAFPCDYITQCVPSIYQQHSLLAGTAAIWRLNRDGPT